MKVPKAASRWLPRLLGPIVLLVILSRVDAAEIAASLEGIRPLPVVGACFAVLPTFPLRSWRWRILLRAGGAKLDAVEALNAYAFSIVVGAATPGRLGEMIKIGHLRSKGVATSLAVLSVALDRIFDLAFLILAGAGAIASLYGGRAEVVVPVVLMMVGASVLALRYAMHPGGRQLAGSLLARLLPGTWGRRAPSALESIAARLKALSGADLVAAGMLTGLIWIATYVAVYLCALSLGFDVPFLDVCGVTAVSSLVTFLPISVLGLGTREASLIALLAPYGIPAAGAVALSALYLGLTLWVVLVCSYSLLTPAAHNWRRRT